jgi:hypothetical protein
MRRPDSHVTSPIDAVRRETERQVEHWSLAASRLGLDDLAAPEFWGRLEQYLGLSLRRHLQQIIDQLRANAEALISLNRSARTPRELVELRQRLLGFRRQFLRAETTLDFFADAIATRTSPEYAGLLRACDSLAHRAMSQILDPIGKPVPVTLTYLDKGLGASILKAGLRLWDAGAPNPVAAIKITRHNLLRPTSLIHEAGHQVAHIAGWNEELAAALSQGLSSLSSEVAGAWSGWASEIAADAVAFVHTGFASVAALHDVLAGETPSVFRYMPGDPHPICYLRVLLGVETCRYFYGEGPWNSLAQSWTTLHSPRIAPVETRRLIDESIPALPAIARIVFDTPMLAFRRAKLRDLVRPERVSPEALSEMATTIGPALFTSSHWLWTESLRILALTGLQAATRPQDLREILGQQERAMLGLGGVVRAA